MFFVRWVKWVFRDRLIWAELVCHLLKLGTIAIAGPRDPQSRKEGEKRKGSPWKDEWIRGRVQLLPSGDFRAQRPTGAASKSTGEKSRSGCRAGGGA